jgi:hypothetical protein
VTDTIVELPDLPLVGTIASLKSAGLNAGFIASALDLPLGQVQQIVVNLDVKPTSFLDEHLADGIRSLGATCLAEADLIVRFGPLDAKLQIIKPMLTALGRHVAQASGGETEDIRSSLNALLASQRELPEGVLDVESEEIPDDD